MKKSYALGLVSLASLMISTAAFAEGGTPSKSVSTNEVDRSSALAWSIAAYVSCDNYDQTLEGIQAEIATLKATDQETIKAMEQLVDEDFACSPVREFASTFLQAPADEQISLVSASATALPNGDTSAQIVAESGIDSRANRAENARSFNLQSRRLPTPPLNRNLQTTSDY